MKSYKNNKIYELKKKLSTEKIKHIASLLCSQELFAFPLISRDDQCREIHVRCNYCGKFELLKRYTSDELMDIDVYEEINSFRDNGVSIHNT